VRAVRPHPNIYLEFSGQVDFSANELGVNRLIWGGHGPSRSYSTELSKILDADLTFDRRLQILGGNLRQLAAPIFRESKR